MHQLIGKSKPAKKEFKALLEVSSEMIRNKQRMIGNRARERAYNRAQIA